MAGGHSIFIGNGLFSTGNRRDSVDAALFVKLGLTPLWGAEPARMEVGE